MATTNNGFTVKTRFAGNKAPAKVQAAEKQIANENDDGKIRQNHFFGNKEARFFVLDDSDNFGVAIFKKLIVLAFAKNDKVKNINTAEINQVVSGFKRVMKSQNLKDVNLDVKNINIDSFKKRGQKIEVLSITIPAIEGINRILDNYYLVIEAVNNASQDLQFRMNNTDIARIVYDDAVISAEKEIFKGFTAMSYIPGWSTDRGLVGEKANIVAYLGIRSEIGFESDELKKFNNYNETYHKVSLFGGKLDPRTHEYVLPFRGKFTIVKYVAVKVTGKGQFEFERNLYTVSLRYRYDRLEDGSTKVDMASGPVGIRLKKDSDVLETNEFVGIFDGETEGTLTALTEDLKILDGAILPELSIMEKEGDAISSEIFDAFSPIEKGEAPEETPPEAEQPQPKTDTSKTADSESEGMRLGDMIAAKKEKSAAGKKGKGKKADKDEKSEETSEQQ